MKKTAILVGVVLAVTMAACVPSLRESFNRDALSRATFELNCPQDQLQMTVLNGNPDSHPLAGASVGVEGCGKKGVYVYTGNGWVLNGLSESAADSR